MTASIPSFDAQRWRAAANDFCAEPWQVFPDHVHRSSRGLPWSGLSVWHQHGPADDLYVPPAGSHCVIVRVGQPVRLLHRHGNEVGAREWRTGEVVLVPAGTPTFWRSDRNRDNIHVDLAPHWIGRASGQERPVRLRASFCTSDPLLDQLARSLIAALDQPTAMSTGFGDALAMAVAVHLVERYGSAPGETARCATLTARQMRRVDAYVQENLRAPCDVAALAQEAGLSPAHFARCFKATSGMTPHQYVTRLRMERARTMLLESQAAVAAVAQATGFSSRAHFAQAFRRHWGQAPAELRRHA